MRLATVAGFGIIIGMNLLSTNVSLPKEVTHDGRTINTGIFKEPVVGPVRVSSLNLEGDGQADLRVHGGIDKAVYVYPSEHYPFWQDQLGREFTYGQFGENLTTEGITEENVYIGDEFQVGSARFQVSQPRQPCFKLGIKMNDPRFVRIFLNSLRVGFYVRVIDEGVITSGDRIEKIAEGDVRFSIADTVRLRFFDHENVPNGSEVANLTALSLGWREAIRNRF